MRFISISFLFVLSILGCSSKDSSQQQLSSKVLDKLNYGIVEIVIPKFEPKNAEYDRPLPIEKLPFKQRNDQFLSIGTAFFVNKTTLASAAHVLRLPTYSLTENFYIRDYFGKTHKIDKIIKYSDYHDLVQFTLSTQPEKIIPLEIKNKVNLSETVYSMGNALGEGISFRAGQVASFTPEVYDGKWNDIRFSSPASPGNSGGPLLNNKGSVVGVIVKKTESENLNFAVPITELTSLSDKKALFYQRDLGISDSDVPTAILKKTWNGEAKLPAKIDIFSREAQAQLKKFYGDLQKEYHAKFDDQLYPKSSGLNTYFRSQSPAPHFAYIKSSSGGKSWDISAYRTRSVPIGNNEKVSFSKSDLAKMFAKVDKPKDMALYTFINNPEMIMERILKAQPMPRTFVNETINITKLGDMIERSNWSDDYGRKWISSRWAYPGFDYFIYMHCLPYPNAAACLVDYNPSAALTYNYLDNMKYNVKQLVIGYEGDIKSWKEFLDLDKNFLPTYFSNVQISDIKGNISIKTPYHSISSKNLDLNDKSSLHFHLGHHAKGDFKEELILFEIFPSPEDSQQKYSLSKVFEPSEENEEPLRVNWKQMKQQKGKFSNKTYTDEGMQRRLFVLNSIDARELASEEVPYRFLSSCDGDIHTSKVNFDKKCDAFQKNTTTLNQ